jgi:hypothetical protein
MAVPSDSEITSQAHRYKRSIIRILRITRFSVDWTSGATARSRKIEVTTLCAGDVGWDILGYFCSALTGADKDIESSLFRKELT